MLPTIQWRCFLRLNRGFPKPSEMGCALWNEISYNALCCAKVGNVEVSFCKNSNRSSCSTYEFRSMISYPDVGLNVLNRLLKLPRSGQTSTQSAQLSLSKRRIYKRKLLSQPVSLCGNVWCEWTCIVHSDSTINSIWSYFLHWKFTCHRRFKT